jgi:hypothetical protein
MAVLPSTLAAPQLDVAPNKGSRIDSRWLAEGLGIRHRNLLQTTLEFQVEILYPQVLWKSRY